MNSGINIVGTFKKTNDENGKAYYAGKINVNDLKKIKAAEMEIVLMPIESVPHGLIELMRSNTPNGAIDMLMFAGTRETEKKKTGPRRPETVIPRPE